MRINAALTGVLEYFYEVVWGKLKEYVELTQEEFEAKMSAFKTELQSFFDEGNALQAEIMKQLTKVKYE
jgi:esterase/lipase